MQQLITKITFLNFILVARACRASEKPRDTSSLDDISDPPEIFRRTVEPQSICMTFKNYQFFKAPHNAVFVPKYPSEVIFFLFLNFLIIKILIFLV